ncbi:MAG TPA: hypothetical protein VHI31_08500, partial [Actinomycetota bacterium]|nr:hypothetical protein [Actinomycetota bacterium]
MHPRATFPTTLATFRTAVLVVCAVLLGAVPAVGSEPAVDWAMAGSTLENVRAVAPTAAAAHFNHAGVHITGPSDRKQYQAPAGWVAKTMVNYKSYAAFVADIENNRIDDRIKTMFYNPEMWSYTPLPEQQDPYTYMRSFCDLAHSKGWNCTVAPARNLVAVPGSVCPQQPREDRSAAYLRCGLASAGARYADAFDIQAQIHQNDPVAYREFVTKAAAQARVANPAVAVRSNLTTESQGTQQTG